MFCINVYSLILTKWDEKNLQSHLSLGLKFGDFRTTCIEIAHAYTAYQFLTLHSASFIPFFIKLALSLSRSLIFGQAKVSILRVPTLAFHGAKAARLPRILSRFFFFAFWPGIKGMEGTANPEWAGATPHIVIIIFVIIIFSQTPENWEELIFRCLDAPWVNAGRDRSRLDSTYRGVAVLSGLSATVDSI